MDLARQAAIKLRKMTTNAYQKVEASYTSMLSYSRQSIKTTSRSHLIDLENMLNDWRKTQLQNCFEILSQVKSTNEEREALEDAKAKLKHQNLQLLGQIQEQERNHARSILQITTERDEATAIVHESQGVVNNLRQANAEQSESIRRMQAERDQRDEPELESRDDDSHEEVGASQLPGAHLNRRRVGREASPAKTGAPQINLPASLPDTPKPLPRLGFTL